MDLSKSEPAPRLESSWKPSFNAKRICKDGNENLLAGKKPKKDDHSERQKEQTSRKVDSGVSSGHKVEEIKKPFKYRCKLCKDRWFMEKKRLYRHYSYAHFKAEIVELFGKKRDQCPFCPKKFEDTQEVVCHVGIVHNKAEEFLQKHIKQEVSWEDGQQESLVEMTCGLCTNKKNFTRRSDLYEHYSCTHFRAQLRPFIDLASDKCPLCDLVHKQPTEYKKIRHIGVVHRMVEDLLPQSLHIPRNLPPLEMGQAVGRKCSGDQKDDHRSGGGAQLECHLCQFKHLRRSRLYSHYAISHYRQQILSKIGVNNLLKLECCHCGERRDEVDGLVRHLGSTHKMVEEFLPEEFILSKSRNKSHRAPPAKEGKVPILGTQPPDTKEGKYLESSKKSFELDASSFDTHENPGKVSGDKGEISTPQKKTQNIRSIFGDSDVSD